MALCVNCFCIVVVQPGDTLGAIAAQFGTPGGFQRIACCNNIPDPNVITPGQVLLVPTPCPGAPPPGCPFQYTVQPGDTMFLIAQRFGVTLNALIAANPQIPNPNIIFPGQVLTIPCPTT
ncbi:MAG: LysM peptidoglycan-binding domain-containing protein [Syntrophothermus sp.]